MSNPPRIDPDSPSHHAGVIAGLTGQPRSYPPRVADMFAYFSGYVEGRATAQAAACPDD